MSRVCIKGLLNNASLNSLLKSKSNLHRMLSTQPLKAHSNKEASRSKTKTNSFMMNIFNGQIETNQVFPFPDVLTHDQVEMLHLMSEPSRKFFNDLNDPLKNDETGKISEKTWEAMKELGCFGLMVPVEYDGAGVNTTQYAKLCELIGANDLAVGVTLGAHQSIGYKGLLLYGNDAQKRKYLADLATGKKIAAFCLTEPGSGSDAGSIKSKAILSEDGKHYILNGSKIWISNGGIADVMTVFAKCPSKNKHGEPVERVTAFFVERAFGGVISGPPDKKMGIKCCNTTEVHFDNVPIPIENVLGEVGEGFKVAMNILNSGRFGMCASLTGTMRACIAKAADHVNNRVQFGSKLADFGGIQEKIARMGMLHYISESIAYMVSGNMDQGCTEFQLEAAIGKVFSSEAAWYVCDETIQILGGMGYMRDCGIEKVMRDLRIFRIFEGANDILRLFVALTGLQYAGSHLKELQRAMKNPVGNLGMIFDVSTKRVFRAVGLSSGNTSVTEHVSPVLRPYALMLSKSVENFGASVEHLLIKYNKDIIHEQFLLNRLANAAIDIFIMAVTLSRTTRSIEKNFSSAEHEINLTKLICTEAHERIVTNLSALRLSNKLKDYDTMKKIAAIICQNSGVSHVHPIGT